MKKFLFLILLCASGLLTAQEWRYEDYTYVNYIKSVKFHLEGLPTTMPIVSLDANQLVLSFDDLDRDVRDYFYTIELCNMDWTPTSLTQLEYIDGFVEDRIESYSFSFKTLQPYTHYELTLPNNRMAWTKSGNYLLKVYEDNGNRTPIISRRFMVVDQQLRIQPNVVRPSVVSKLRTHQEVDFVVNYEDLQIQRPQREIRAAILQNGRWDNAITDIPPFMMRRNQLVFDYQDKIIFPGGKEFRFLDLRSLRYRSENISEIERFTDGFEVILFRDQKRTDSPFLNLRDLNGRFIIETFDQQDFDLSGDYADVYFTLASPMPYAGSDVYIVGAMTDWQLYPENKMEYNPAINAYVGRIVLKQGYYDYAYAVTPRSQSIVDLSPAEGDSQETENEYTILIYYRPFGSRYDQLIGAVSFGSNR